MVAKSSRSVKSLQEQHEELLASLHQLTVRLDKMFSLFEEASKHVAEVESSEAKITALSSKLESLLEQNKNIAKGLILLEKYVRGKSGLDTTSGPKQLSEYGGL